VNRKGKKQNWRNGLKQRKRQDLLGEILPFPAVPVVSFELPFPISA
jgi:hypothetical protein